MPRAALAVLLLVPVLLVGCAGPGGGGGPSPGPTATGASSGPPTAPPPPPTSLVVDLLPDFAFEGCRGLSVVSAQPIDRVQTLLPTGFTAFAMNEGFGL